MIRLNIENLTWNDPIKKKVKECGLNRNAFHDQKLLEQISFSKNPPSHTHTTDGIQYKWSVTAGVFAS